MKTLKEFKKDIKNCDIINIIQINQDYLDSDILERLDGKECFIEQDMLSNDRIYSVHELKEDILDNKDDDTNESTKDKIETLYHALFNFDYFMIIDR